MRKLRRRRARPARTSHRAVARRNPRRKVARRRSRRAYASNPINPRRSVVRRRRSYRRNPPGELLGFSLKSIAYAGAAVVLSPFIEKQVMGLLPASMAGTKAGRWGVKIGSAALIGYGAKKLLGTQAGNLAMVALGANLIADAVSEFAPQLTGMGLYPGLGAFPYNPGNSLPLNERRNLPPAASFPFADPTELDRLSSAYAF